MNILFLADPNSIHDIKWMTFFSKEHFCYLIARKEHLIDWHKNQKSNFFADYNIEIVGSINDFSIKGFVFNFREAHKIKKILKKKQIDIFHIFYADPNALWAIFKGMFDVPLVLTTRGSDILLGIQNFFKRKDLLALILRRLYKLSFSNFNRITSTSLSQIKKINELFERDDVVKIYTGVDIISILVDTKVAFPTELSKKKPYIFFPRYMRSIYNHELALDSIGLLPEAIQQGFSFVFLDKNGPDQKYIQTIKDKMKANSDVDFVFLPRQKQSAVFELYKRASLVVMTPLSDGSPVSAMEAMACNTPLILPPLKYDEEIINNKTTFIFSEFNPHSLANVMVHVLTTPKASETIVESAFRTISEKCNREKEMNYLLSIYKSLIKS